MLASEEHTISPPIPIASPPRSRWVLTGLCLFALAALLLTSVRRPFWFDELFTFYIAGQPSMSDMIHRAPYDGQPLGFYLITRASQSVFGANEVATRLPETAFALLLCASLYLYLGRRHGLALAIFGFTAPLMTQASFYATEARPYGLLLGCAGLAIAGWDRIVRHRPWGFALLAGGCLLGTSFHYFGAIQVVAPIVAAEAVRCWLRGRIDVRVWLCFLLGAVPILLAIPVLRASTLMSAGKTSPVFWAKPGFDALFNTYTELYQPAMLFLMFSLGVLCVVLLLRVRVPGSPEPLATQPEDLALAIAFLAVPAIAVLVTRFTTGYFMPRYGLTGIIALPLLIGVLNSLPGFHRVIPVIAVSSAFFWCGLAAVRVARPSNSPTPSAISEALFDGAGSPLVIANGLQYLPTVHYGSPALRERLVYLVDVPYALQQPDFMPEASMAGAREILPAHLEDYREFIQKTSHFWVLYTGTPRLEWTTARLVQDGFTLTLVAQREGAFLFEARRATSERP